MKTIMLLLLSWGINAQVLTTLPHVIEGVEYDYMPHGEVDHLPFALGADPDSLFNELYYNALTLAGYAESAYFQNEEWVNECRLDSQRVIDFYLNHFRPRIDLARDQWNALRNIQTDPVAIDNFALADPFAQRALSDVQDAIDGYVGLMYTVECDQQNPQLNGYVSDMARARYFYEQIVLGLSPYYNRHPKNPLR